MYSQNDLDQSIYLTTETAVPTGIVDTDTYLAGALPLNGSLINAAGRYVSSNPQFLLITAADDESANTFTFTGKDASGMTYTFSILGPDTTTLIIPVPFESIEIGGITIANATTGDISIGTTDATATPWLVMDTQRPYFAPGIGVFVETGATVDYDIELTIQNAIQPIGQSGVQNFPTRIYVDQTGKTATDLYTPSATVKFSRIVLNSASGGGIWAEIAQAGYMNSQAVRTRS